MSVLVVTLDTENESLSATIDGQSVENVMSISVYKDDYAKSGFYAHISVESEDIGDAKKHVSYCLADKAYASKKNLKPTKTPGVYKE